MRQIEALISEILSDMGPVLVFDMSIVVFVIGSGSGEGDGFFSVGEIANEVPI